MLIRLALRNIALHRFKSLLVGAILLLGSALVVVGTSLIDAIDRGMERSLVNSVTGHLQLYSKKAKDEFQIFGSMDGSMPNIDRIRHFKRLHDVLMSLDGVKTVVPMGIDSAVTTTDNFLQRKLAELRDTVRRNDKARMKVLKRHVRRIIAVLDSELSNASKLIDLERFRREQGDPEPALRRTRTDAFWNNFDQDPLNALEFLENEIGPLGLSEDLIWIRYLGTDTELFQQSFDRFEIVDGKMIPPGKRGFLFNKRVYEDFVKNKTARRLDQIKERLDEGYTIDRCDDCKTWMRLNRDQAASLVFQLDDHADASVRKALATELGIDKGSTVALMKRFMAMSDKNFARRYALFYRSIAPHIVLYTVQVGDEVVLTAYARRGGYSRKVPVKVYGTFRFRSLDRSPLAGGFNLMDIMSFRDLWGYMTQERRKEQAAIRAAVGVSDVTRDNVEALFEGDSQIERVEQSTELTSLNMDDFKLSGKRFTQAIHNQRYTKDQLWKGVVLNAAVMLNNGQQLKRRIKEIKTTLKKHGLAMNVVTWRKASGLVGNLVDVIRLVLWTAVLIMFVVALIIINNALLMSTMERTREIGTMRAIGAQRGFIMRMLLAETAVLAGLFAGFGVFLGAGVISFFKAKGIPAVGDFLHFLFAGPSLHPQVDARHMAVSYLLVVSIALISTIYPTRVANRITPREAMAERE